MTFIQTENKLASLQAGPWTGPLRNLSKNTSRMFTRVELFFLNPIQNRFHNLMDFHRMYVTISYSQFGEIVVMLTFRIIIVYAMKIPHPMQQKPEEKRAELITNKLSSNHNWTLRSFGFCNKRIMSTLGPPDWTEDKRFIIFMQIHTHTRKGAFEMPKQYVCCLCLFRMLFFNLHRVVDASFLFA